VILESFRPGVAARLGIGPDIAPARAVYCSLTGFGWGGPHEQRAGHDLNYVGGQDYSRTPRRRCHLSRRPISQPAALGVVTEVLARCSCANAPAVAHTSSSR